MNMDKLSVTLCGIIILFINRVSAASYCYDIARGGFYCEYGCCGDTLDEYCCGVYDWVIGVAVVGVIIVIGVIIACICFFQKKKARTGRVIQPNNTTTNTTVQHPPQHQPYGQQPYGQQPYGQQQQMNQPYGQPMQPMGGPSMYPPPPPPTYADAAYPPKM